MLDFLDHGHVYFDGLGFVSFDSDLTKFILPQFDSHLVFSRVLDPMQRFHPLDTCNLTEIREVTGVQQTGSMLALEKNREVARSPWLGGELFRVVFSHFEDLFSELAIFKVGEELFDVLFVAEMRPGKRMVVDNIRYQTPLVAKYALVPGYECAFLPGELDHSPARWMVVILVFVGFFDRFLVNLASINLLYVAL